MKKALLTILVVALLVAMAGCAPGPNELAVQASPPEAAGFLQGLWHGFISPVTFIISLFNHSVSIYEVHNNGGWYNFGFMIGVSAIFGGGGRSSHRARRRKYD